MMTTAQTTAVVQAAQHAGPEGRAALVVLFARVPAYLWDELAAAFEEGSDAAGRLPTRAARDLDEWIAPPGVG